jgi:lipopolysaccharide transport system ATP-binding protein
MAYLKLEKVDVDLPVFGQHARSLRRTLVAGATGGRLCREAGRTFVRALEGIDLELRDGDRLGIMGHNGGGKTTLLRVLAGAYPPTRGTIHREGSVASLIEPAAGLEPSASGWENIVLRGLVLGRRKGELLRARREIAEFSGLGDFLSMPVSTYSSGMVMRLAFAIVTHFPAEIVVMDEWLSVGDAEFRGRAEERMREMVDRSGILAVATHSEELVRRECGRVMQLTRGRVWLASPSVAAISA